MSTLRAAYFKNVKMKQAALYFSPFVHEKKWPWMWCKDPDEEQEVRLKSKPSLTWRGKKVRYRPEVLGSLITQDPVGCVWVFTPSEMRSHWKISTSRKKPRGFISHVVPTSRLPCPPASQIPVSTPFHLQVIIILSDIQKSSDLVLTQQQIVMCVLENGLENNIRGLTKTFLTKHYWMNCFIISLIFHVGIWHYSNILEV